MNIDQLHNRARRAIESGEMGFRSGADYLAEARKLGATQRESASAIGKSPAWVNALLKWHDGGFKSDAPFPSATRSPVQRAEQKNGDQKKASRPATTAEQAQAQTAKANAQFAKAEAQKARADAAKARAEAKRVRAEANERSRKRSAASSPACSAAERRRKFIVAHASYSSRRWGCLALTMTVNEQTLPLSWKSSAPDLG
jgi:hypothetical protein